MRKSRIKRSFSIANEHLEVVNEFFLSNLRFLVWRYVGEVMCEDMARRF